MKSAFFFERTTEPSCVFEMLEQDFDFVTRLEIGKVLELFERDVPSDLKPMSRTTMLSRISSTLHLTISPSSIEASVPLYISIISSYSLGRVLVFFVELGAAIGERAQLRLLLVAL